MKTAVYNYAEGNRIDRYMKRLQNNKKFQEDLFDQRELSDKRLNELKKFLTIKDNNIFINLLKNIYKKERLIT